MLKVLGFWDPKWWNSLHGTFFSLAESLTLLFVPHTMKMYNGAGALAKGVNFVRYVLTKRVFVLSEK